MDLSKSKVVPVIGLISGVCALISLFLPLGYPWGTSLTVLVIAVVLICFLLEFQGHKLSLLSSGVRQYYKSFEPDKNADVFAQVQEHYRYFGITFASVATSFRSWYSSHRQGSPSIQILLLDPEALDILEFQARYESDLLSDPLTQPERARIDDIVHRTRQKIYATLAELATLPGATPHIQVRLHKDRARRWTHEVDGKLLYLGLLRRGSIGLNSPVFVLTRQSNWTLFNHHHDGWEGLWQASRPVDLGTYKKGAANAGP